MSNFSFLDILIYTPMPFGQLWARIFSLNNSTDQSWLLSLMILPILSILFNLDIKFTGIIMLLSNLFPLLLMKMNKIKMGTGTSESLDKFVLLPIFVKLLLMIFFSTNDLNQIFELLTIFGTIVMRKMYKCNKLSSNLLIKSVIDTSYIYSVIELLKYLITEHLNIMKCNDNSNSIFNSLLVWSLSLIIGYSTINLVNDTNLDTICSDINYNESIMFLISIFIIFYIKKHVPLSNLHNKSIIDNNKSGSSNIPNDKVSMSKATNISNSLKKN